MENRAVVHNTFSIERSYPVPPDRVFDAFADPAKKKRWFVEGEHHQVQHFEMDFRPGGKELARFRFNEGTPIAGMFCSNETTYLDIVPNSRIVLVATMNLGGQCISAALATVELLASNSGTDLILTHQAAFFEGADGPEMRKDGWIKLMERLSAELRS